MRHGMTTSGLFQQGQAHSPSFFSVARAMGQHADALEDLDLVVIDESFVDFVEVERNPSVAAEAVVRPNVTGQFMRFGLRPDTEPERSIS